MNNTVNFPSRPYRGDEDRAAVLDLVARANVDQTRTPYWHTGDVLWQMYRSPAFDPAAQYPTLAHGRRH